MKKYLVTGGAGFIGRNFIHYLFRKYPNCHVINLDKLTYAGNVDNLLDVANNPQYKFVHGDIADIDLVKKLLPGIDYIVINLDKLTYAGNLDNLLDVANNPQYKFVHGDIADIDLVKKLLPGIDYIVHFAAESHNDRSILDPSIFLRTNVLGTQMLLEAAKDAHIKRFHQISTCEVFGELELNEERKFQESDPYQPKTPYNASKAAANHVVMSYYHTFQIPVTMSHCCNIYGSYQFPEKLIPLFATNALEKI